MYTDGLQEREIKARQHIEAAIDLLPFSIRDNPKSLKAINAYIEASTWRFGLSRLHLVFNWLEKLGEANDCSPQFWQEMSRASAQMAEETNYFVTSHLRFADHQLKRVETNLENEDTNIEEWARKSGDNLQNTRNHFLTMAALDVSSPLDLLRRDRKYGRMTEEQEQMGCVSEVMLMEQ